MAFERKDNKIKEALGHSQETSSIVANLSIPSKNNAEKTKNFTMTLQPSVRRKLDDLAAQNGYRSASSFLNDLIKNL